MAAIGYHAIEQALVNQISSYLGSGYVVTAEVEQPMETKPWVAIYLDRRDAPAEQPIAAGKRARYTLRFSIWCWYWSLESVAKAAEGRDSLVGKVELAIIGDRSIGGNAAGARLMGGEFVTTTWEREGAPSAQAYVSGGEIIVEVDVDAST